jgi:hypothetical protein
MLRASYENNLEETQLEFSHSVIEFTVIDMQETMTGEHLRQKFTLLYN